MVSSRCEKGAGKLEALMALAAQERVLGAEHPVTLAARGSLAIMTGETGGCGRGPRPVRRAAAHP